MRVILLGLWLVGIAMGQSDVAGLKLAIQEAKRAAGERGATRGATPALRAVKHRLLELVEARLEKMREDGDERVLATQINRELELAGLVCGFGTQRKVACEIEMGIGWLRPIRLERKDFWLVLVTSVGIDGCGEDESAYVYAWQVGKWKRLWGKEETEYTKREYRPKTIVSVEVGAKPGSEGIVVLLLGMRTGCTSAWHPVYYSAYQIGVNADEKPILDKAESAYLGDDPPIVGASRNGEVLVEFRVGSVDLVVHNRRAVRRFVFENNRVKRVSPLALRPRDFVEEWLSEDWSAIEAWAHGDEDSARLERWHRGLAGRHLTGKFESPTKRCGARSNRRQVGLQLDSWNGNSLLPGKTYYFLVEWDPPYEFRMVDVAERPWPGCDREDRRADEEDVTLFPRGR